MKSFFVPQEVAKITNLSYRQIQYWDKTNFIKPSYRRKSKYRLYTFTDLFQIDLCCALKKKGLSIQKQRKTIEVIRKLIPQLSYPLIDMTFLVDEDRVLLFNGEVACDEGTEEIYTKYRVRDLRTKADRFFPPVNTPAPNAHLTYG